ncbi:MAG: hypothetical protein GY862_33580 [Gammaproteobacteria bacterium]|nr:hypothetical protein [Gammaproteobacteria bacterium]
MKHYKFSMFFTIFLALLLSLTAYASSAKDMSITINLAGKQRMLTQKMSKEILLIAKGIDTEANKKNLKETAALFNKTLKGLINGDADFGLVKTEDPGILKQLGKIGKRWEVFRKSVVLVLGGDTSMSILEAVGKQNRPLLMSMNKAVKLYEKTAGSKKLDANTALTINLAGRQRMLSQKMTKELFLVASGVKPTPLHKASLDSSITSFSTALTGLLDGGEHGLFGTKDPAIREQLLLVQKLWKEYKVILENALKSEKIPQADLVKAAKLNLPLLKEMNKAVMMYEDSVK